jgi:uncharacterized phage protein (TIGR01671 family)
MQREIKFRAWSTKYNRFLDCETSQFQHYIHGYSNPVDRNLNHKTITIQQFTGLIDKNEKEIYEGDVLERIGNGSFCKIVVSWSDKECCFVYNNVGNLHGSPSPLHDNFVNLCDWTYWVVCGNIFENPELLK